MLRYHGIFAAIYIGASLLLQAVVALLDVDPGSGVNMAVLIAAGFGTAGRFVTDHRRAPDAPEKRKLVLGSLGVCLAYSVMGVLILALLGETFREDTRALLSTIPPLAWVLIVLIVLLVYWLLLQLCYGWYARRLATRFSGRD